MSEQGPQPESRTRDASARLDVEGGVGDIAELREAMDPANRSLGEALRLSFRLLQTAIVVLFVLFIFSGFKTVEINQSGVATVWGRMIDSSGLEPGLQMNWPPPVGEFVLFKAEGRIVDDGNAFTTRGLGVAGREMEVSQSRATDRLKPERDGSFITSGGEIGHWQVEARYEIDDPRRFLEHIADAQADKLVRLALRRACVSVAASHTLAELRTGLSADAVRGMLRDQTQQMLDASHAGIRIAEVSFIDEPQPPFYLQKSFEEFSRVNQRVEADIEDEKQRAQETLIAAAGEHYAELEDLLHQYEQDFSDHKKRDALLIKINEMVDQGRVSGDFYRILANAERYRTEVERTLGSEARRFKGLLSEWRVHPELVVAQRLLEVRAQLMSDPSAELIFVPYGLGSVKLDISGLQHIRDTRRRRDLDRRESDTWAQQIGGRLDNYRRIDELKGDKAARRLKIDDSGRLRGMREGN